MRLQAGDLTKDKFKKGKADPSLLERDKERQALIEQARATQAALDEPAPEMTSGQVVGGLYGAHQGRLAGLLAEHALLGPRRVVTPNKEHKYAVRKEEEQLAGDLSDLPPEPAPFVAPMRAEGENDAAYEMRMMLAQEAYDTDNALALDEWQRRGVPAARDIGRDGNIGFNEAKRREADLQLEQRTAANERIAAIRAEGATATRQANVEARELNREVQQQREDATTALQQLQKTEQDARAKLDSIPAINGQRRTQQMGWGAKLAALGAAFAGGFSGQGSMAGELRSLREEDVAEQQLNYDMGVRSYEAARDAASQGLDIFHSVMQGLGDREAGAMTYASMVMEDQIAALQEEEQNAASEELASQYRQARIQVEEELRQNRDATQRYMEANPKNTVTVADPYRAQRRRNEKLQDMEIEHGYGLENKGIDVALKGEEQAGRIEGERIKAEGRKGAAIAKEQVKADADIKKATHSWGQVETLIKDYRAKMKGDYHGVGLPLTGDQNQRIATRDFKRSLKLLATSGFTGATATEAQKEDIDALVDGDFWEWTDEAFDQRLTDMENTASSQRRYFQNQLGPTTQKLTADQLPTFVPDDEEDEDE